MKVGSPMYDMLANYYAARREIGEADALAYIHKNGATVLECPNQIYHNIELNIGDKNSRIVKDRPPVSSPHGNFGMDTGNKVFRRIILNGMINDRAEIEAIKDEILKNCETEGIDPKTFCFDKYILEKA